jgi:hypothetical protein
LEEPRDGQTEGRTSLGSEAGCQGSQQQQPTTGRGKENRRPTEDCAQSRQEVCQESESQRAQDLQGRGSTSEASRAPARGCQEEDLDRAKAHADEGEEQGQGPSNQLGCPAGETFGA